MPNLRVKRRAKAPVLRRREAAPCFSCNGAGVLTINGDDPWLVTTAACPTCRGTGALKVQHLVDALTVAGFVVL